MRRQQPQSKEGPSTIQSPVSSRAPYGGFGRGEGGVFGGAKFGGALGDSGGAGTGRQPGSLGGGFGGVGKRPTRRETSGDEQPRSATASTWRSARNASGTFEGVLGFGNSQASAVPPADDSNAKAEDDRTSWASGQRKWRQASQEDRQSHEQTAEPAAVQEEAPREPAPGPTQDAPTETSRQEQQDLGNINWFYRDPNGQEQGPFTGNQMHEWYSHSYFKDDLPIRRERESTFVTLSELKTSTGNAVQPFLSQARPRLPPNLPIPVAALSNAGSIPSPTLNDSFHRLNMQGGVPQQPFHQPAAIANHFQPQFDASPGFMGPQQPWNPAPGPHTPGRMNNGYGSIGGQQPFPTYGAPIGTPVRDPFGPSAFGQPTWGATKPATAWQHQAAPISAPAHAPMPQQQQMEMPTESYFPEQPEPVDQIQPEQAPIDVNQFDETDPEFDTESQMEEDAVEDIVGDDDEEDEEEVPEVAKAAPASAWGKPASAPRKDSISEPTPAAASKLPPAPASLPPKPAAAKAEPSSPIATPLTPSADRATPKPAPWADKPSVATGPSLREIQEAEARQAEARKIARAEARATASPAPGSSDDHHISTLSWGLPQQGAKVAAPPTSSSTPPAPAWGGGSEGPKKTLKQIQEEEERRKAKQDSQARAAQAAVGGTTVKRGYADLASHSSPAPALAAASQAAGWTTVGTGGKSSTPVKPTVTTTIIQKTVVQKPVTPVVAVPKPIAVAAKVNGSEEASQPSVEFIRWTKQALTGLTVNVDDFIQMLLQFPIDPPASSRGEVLEIISDSVYASSRTLDGRRFAQEFFTRRKADSLRNATGSRPVQKITSLADVVKTQPKPPASADLGFKVVKTKKNRRA